MPLDAGTLMAEAPDDFVGVTGGLCFFSRKMSLVGILCSGFGPLLIHDTRL